jgi:hypothetical protein
LHVVVATNARDKAVELVKRMEKSPHFRAPQVEAENTLGGAGAEPAGGNIQFDIAAVYVPFADDSDTATGDAAPEKAKEEGKTAPGKSGKSSANTAQNRSAGPGGGR